MDAYLNSNFSLHDLLEKQIPAELGRLEESSNNLERVAAYSEVNYKNVSSNLSFPFLHFEKRF